MSVVYFYIDEVARDSITASILIKRIKKRDIDLIYGNRFSMRFIMLLRFADLVILPSLPHFQTIFPALGASLEMATVYCLSIPRMIQSLPILQRYFFLYKSHLRFYVFPHDSLFKFGLPLRARCPYE
ncbi:MAG: hypothetical protein HOD90_13085 [Nitrospina sp.]|jgi:predicted neutral ceramidase superfamily lipid hydrolase|nr:hypothetical protein [Nitrospina sp.]